jgi:hypothetical protein
MHTLLTLEIYYRYIHGYKLYEFVLCTDGTFLPTVYIRTFYCQEYMYCTVLLGRKLQRKLHTQAAYLT